METLQKLYSNIGWELFCVLITLVVGILISVRIRRQIGLPTSIEAPNETTEAENEK